jgi:formylglycine-generating enzyme required for sulfatase activity
LSTAAPASVENQNSSSEIVVGAAPTDHIPTPPAEDSFYPGQLMVSPIDGMVMVYVPAGEFMMGSPDSQGQDDEHPQHKVTLDAYWIDQTEVTNNMYARCEGANRCTPPQSKGSFSRSEYYGEYAYADYPVINVNWEQAAAYCEWAGRELPSEAQWEYAARGPQGFTYPWGNSFSCRYGNFDDEKKKDEDMVEGGKNCDGQAETAPVGSFREGTSPFGVMDMAGNVWEWVADWYGDYSSNSVINPTGPKMGEFRVARGGSWNNSENGLRTADRIREWPNTADYMLGFRCAVSETEFP